MNRNYDVFAELQRIRRRQNVLLVMICILVIWLTALTFAGDISDAMADRAKMPREQWPVVYYLGIGHLPPEAQKDLRAIVPFAVCSLTRNQVIEQQLPVPITPTLWRLDLRALAWEKTFPKIAQATPYKHEKDFLPLVVRADWFVQYALDTNVGGDTYYLLLFGEVPKDLNDFTAKLGVQRKNDFVYGHIEANSGVAVNRVRLLSTLPTESRADLWETFDFRTLDRGSDPLEHLDRKFRYDAQEVIGPLPKFSSQTGQFGHLQAYALANASGELQTKAPADIVTDGTAIRGVEIRNAVSCIACHQEGLRPLKVNGLRKYILSGAEAYADYKTQREIERFHLSDVAKLVGRSNEDYATAVGIINGLSPAANSQAFRRVVSAYDSQLTVGQAAKEVFLSAEQLKLALAYYGTLPARLAALAEGQPIARSSWESEWLVAYQAMVKWRTEVLKE